MQLVKAICPNCGGFLEVDASNKAAICTFCKLPFIIEEAINNYTTHIEHLHADNVTINDDRTAAARLEAGEANLKLKHWPEAEKVFKEVCDLTPQDYRGWWGRIRAITQEFTADLFHGDEIATLNDLFNSVSTFLNGPEKAEIVQTFDSYIGRVTEINRRSEDLLSRKAEDLRGKIKELEDEKSRIQDHLGKGKDWDLRDGTALGLILRLMLIVGIALSLFGIPVGFLLAGVSVIAFLATFVHNKIRDISHKNASHKIYEINDKINPLRLELATSENALKLLNDSQAYIIYYQKDEAIAALERVTSALER